MTKEAEIELSEIIRECNDMSKYIIRRLCQRAVRTFNKTERKLKHDVFADDYPTDFNFFDKLCIELQTKTLDEINPFLKDYVYGTLESEYERLSREERFIVDHSDYFEMGSNSVTNKIYSEFCNLYNEHTSLKKIEDYLAKR